MNIGREGDFTTKQSARSVDATLQRFLEILAARKVTQFAVIDQRAEARRVGLDLRETVVVLFGNPAAGTPLMNARPLAALDLPLKVVIWSDDDRTNVSYLAPRAFAERHGFTTAEAAPVASVDALTDALVATD
jgi:uncharacterized protein (DUF302 family)